MKELFRNAKFMTGFIILASLFILAMLAPWINGYRLGGRDVLITIFRRGLPPSIKHPLGTDASGRDYLGLLLEGLRVSLLVGVIASFVATLLSLTIGLVAGYVGGRVDVVLDAVSNTWLLIPSFPILLSIAAFLQKGLDLITMSILLSFFLWAGGARVLRSQALSIRSEPHIMLAKVSGMGTLRIVFMEVLPALIPFIVLSFSRTMIGAIGAETGMRLIGLGPPMLISIGELMGRTIMAGYLAAGIYHLVLPPIIVLMLIFIGVNFMNVGMDEVFNPRLRRISGI